MSVEYTYNKLRLAIINHADDRGSEFLAELDDFIAKGHARCTRDLDLENREQWISLSISGGDREVEKGPDVIHVNSLFIRNPSTMEWDELPKRSFEWLLMYEPVESVVGVPKYFGDRDEARIYVVPTPDQSYTAGNARARVIAKSSMLTPDNQLTFVSKFYGDLLFNACMIEAKEFQKNEGGARWYAAKYESLLPSTEREIEDSRRKRYKNLNTGTQGADD